MIKDIHTHNLTASHEAIVSLSPREYTEKALSNGLYSIGVHPWHIAADTAADLDLLDRLADNANVVAIGETGIDIVKSTVPLFKQMQIFRRHIEISETHRLPLIIHDVKAHDIICGLRRDLKPEQEWIIHGFRGKPTVARMLLDCGCSLSYGEHFNPESLQITPGDRLFAETDESALDIDNIIARLTSAVGSPIEQMLIDNTARLFTSGR